MTCFDKPVHARHRAYRHYFKSAPHLDALDKKRGLDKKRTF